MYKKYQDIGKLYPLICKNKALNIMKISILLLLLGILSVSATGYSQEARVSITVNNTTINEVFTEIKAQTNYSFWFDVKDISWGMEEQKVKLMPPFLHSKQKSKYVRMRRELLDIVEVVEEKEEEIENETGDG